MVLVEAGAFAKATPLIVRPARAGDGMALAPLLRLCDQAELLASTGSADYAGMLEQFIARGEETFCAEAGRPVALCGRSETRSYGARARARIWMLGSDEIANRQREVLTLARIVLPQLVGKSVGWNYIDERNTVHIRFLQYLGARFYDREATTLHDPSVHFIPFEICVTPLQ